MDVRVAFLAAKMGAVARGGSALGYAFINLSEFQIQKLRFRCLHSDFFDSPLGFSVILQWLAVDAVADEVDVEGQEEDSEAALYLQWA